MATVYKAYQPNMDRDVAIKVILKSLDRHEEAVQRFQREARLIARLEHPHILPVYDFDGGHDPPYIVMRYLDGGTLKDILRQGLLPLHEVSYLIQQVGTALDYAHRQGIVHRDVKTSNILVDREGNAFVTDFGIARMVAEQSSGDQITGTGVIVGTPDYMAPEQIMGAAQVDHRADIYALGVIFFQMITGHLPYTSDNPAGLLVQHLQGEIPIATALNDDLPEEADVIIRRTLAKDPDERYLSALAMANAVTGALGGIVSSRPAKLGQAAGESMIVRRLGPELSDTGSSKTPSEQNKNITALYANSSEYSEIIDEILGGEESRKAVRALWESAEVVVDEYGGLITSSTDDTMLAIWGADATREDDAERAVRAALAIRNSLIEAMQDLIDEDLDEEPLPLDIGINTGIALLSPMDDGRQVTASGATIGLTNRLMQQARGAILITHETYTQVRGVFDVEPDTPLRMRRSRRSIMTYRVMVIKPRAFHLHSRGIEGVETQMVGRDAELKSLQNAFLDAVEEEGTQMVSVISEPGLGKSRLLYEFSNWAELRPERYWILRGRPTPEMTGRPYSLLRDIISFRYEILDSDESHVVRDKLEEGLRKQIGPNEEMAHLLGHLAGFEFDDSPFIQGLQGDPQQLTNRAKKLFEEWLIDLAEVNPVVIELEDLHFSDDATLDLFSGFVSNNEESRVLLVCLARPELYERRARWGVGLPFHLRIDLRPLDRRESRSLVREILTNISQVPKSLRDLLVDRAEGNPFYLEELVKMLIDDRVIIKDSEDLWRVEESRIGHLDVPGTL
jgi:serine/threonine protein kinase